MIFVTTAVVLLTISGATAALAPKVSNAIGSCIRGPDQRVERDDILGDSSPPRAVVARLPHRSANNRGSSNRNNDAGSLFILLQIHIGRQLLRVDSLGSAGRLYNFWGSIRFPPTQRGSPHEATERVLLWQGDAGHTLPSTDEGVNDGSAGGSDNGAVVRLAVGEATLAAVTAAPGVGPCVPVVSTAATFVAAEEDGNTAASTDGVMEAASRATMASPRPPPLSLGNPELAFSSSASTEATEMVAGCLSVLSPLSSERQATAAPSRGRRRTRQGPTSPRTRSTRPPSPRRAPVSLLGSPSPQRSGAAASTAAGPGAAAALSSSRATATKRHGSRVPSGSRSEHDPDLLEASCDKGAPSRLTTPPLTPASTRSSTATAASTASNNDGSGAFFGGSRSCILGDGVGPEKGIVCRGPSKLPEGNSRGVVARNTSVKDRIARAEQHIKLVKRNLQEQQEQQQQDDDEKRQKTSLQEVVRSNLAILEEAETGLAGTGGAKQELVGVRSVGGGGDDGDESEEAGIADPGTGEFGAIVDAVKPGQLRTLFIRNLRANMWGASSHTCARVRLAMMSLGEDEEFGNVMGGLEEVEVLGEGSFGVVSAVNHSILGGTFAIKKLKEGATSTARYCATVEMIALARLAAVPAHANVVSAVCMDDRQGAIGSMPFLLRRADNDLGRVLRTGGWGMPAKLSCLEQVTSGLRHMHAQGIGHGDIKLENILLFDDGEGGCSPKLCDFGMSRALGELRPSMMGTPGYMPLEVMAGSVKTHTSQDTFAMAAAAFVVCVAPEKAQANMFTSPDLYTTIEAKRKKTLESLGKDDPFVEAQTQSFQTKMTKRTMGDGSFAKLLTADNLNPDLGSRDVMDMVSLCLPAFLDKNPDNRPGLANFQEVMKNLAVIAANNNGGINAVRTGENVEDDDEDGQSGGIGDGEDADGIDLDDHDDDYFEDDDQLF